jgi:hypothetical protein
MYILAECIAEIVEKKQINVFYRPQHRAGIKDFAFHFISGRQIGGKSSVEIYRQCLLSGCR